MPKNVNQALMKAMSKDPKERFATCTDFANALSGVKGSSAPKPKDNKKLIFLIAGCASLLVCAAIGYGCWKMTRPAENKIVQVTVTTEVKKENPPEKPPPQDVNILRADVKRMKADIESADPAPGQTFEQHLSEFKENYETGELAVVRNDIPHAYDYFSRASEAAKWILKNIPLREKADVLRQQCIQIQTQADEYDGGNLAPAPYKNGEARLKSATESFENGEFECAASLFEQALGAFTKASKVAKQLKHQNALKSCQDTLKKCKDTQKLEDWEYLEECAEQLKKFDASQAAPFFTAASNGKKTDKLEKQLSLARLAKREQNWEKAIEHAEEAHKIDESSEEANKIYQEAVEQLEPKIMLCATVNGEKVEADVTSLKTQPKGEAWPKKLKSGEDYAFRITYKDRHGNEYAGRTEFTCNWKGEKTCKVELKKNEFDGKVYLTGEIVIELAKVEMGTFTMSRKDGENQADEKEHTATLTRDFYIGVTEVTQEQWKALMGSNPSHFIGDKRPVEQVSWYDAIEFCKKLNERTSDMRPAGYHFTLPTETQWEYASCGGHKNNRDYKYSGSNIIDNVAWYTENSSGWKVLIEGEGTHEVGKKQPNDLYLYDMSGNVSEWCLDVFDVNKKDSDMSKAEFTPEASMKGYYHIHRGGSWHDKANLCRSAFRGRSESNDHHLGFRVALVPVHY